MNLDLAVILIIIVSSKTFDWKDYVHAAAKILFKFSIVHSLCFYYTYPRDELEIVEAFTSSLPAETWVGCKFQMLNRPVAPILVLLFKK